MPEISRRNRERSKSRPGRGSGKGSEFERWVCKQLSLWWTGGERDDVFWRTAGSGGRATNRRRKGQSTANSAGDICALDPIGIPFLRVFAVEIKRGYNSVTVSDLLDRKEGAPKGDLEKWIAQAQKSQEDSGAISWLIIHKRDKREPLIYVPSHALWTNLIVKMEQETDWGIIEVDNTIEVYPFPAFLTLPPAAIQRFAPPQ